MATPKYAKHVIQDPFYEASAPFNSAQVFKGTGADGSGVVYEYHCINRRDWSIDATCTHDVHELLCFVGGDPTNINDLGAEVSIHLGANDEEHLINSAAVVSIPPGLKHGPVTVNKYSRPFVLLRILNTQEFQSKIDSEPPKEEPFGIQAMTYGSDVTKDGNHYWVNILKGPFYMGYEPGWAGTSLWAHHDEYKNGTTLGYHCIRSIYDMPYTHEHDFHELLCFVGGDPEDIHDLGAEVSVCLGDELEKQTFTTPTILSLAPGLKHCPLLVENVRKPVVFFEISTTREFYGKSA
jgi:hypothetical protein